MTLKLKREPLKNVVKRYAESQPGEQVVYAVTEVVPQVHYPMLFRKDTEYIEKCAPFVWAWNLFANGNAFLFQKRNGKNFDYIIVKKAKPRSPSRLPLPDGRIYTQAKDIPEMKDYLIANAASPRFGPS